MHRNIERCFATPYVIFIYQSSKTCAKTGNYNTHHLSGDGLKCIANGVQNAKRIDQVNSPRTRRGGCASPRSEKTRLTALETGQQILSVFLK
jgi:hypothetical protein